MVSACLKPIAPHRISGGTSRRNAPSTGSSAGTISGWNSTLQKQAAAAMGCTWIGSTGTREGNQPWPFCFRWRRCAWRKICWRVLGNRSPPKSNRRFRSRFSGITSPWMPTRFTSNARSRCSGPTSHAFFCGHSVRGIRSGPAGLSPGSCRSRKTESALSWTKYPPNSPSDTSRSTNPFWNDSNRSETSC
jgi:hypothetical protein